jgi:hypothetical protein
MNSFRSGYAVKGLRSLRDSLRSPLTTPSLQLFLLTRKACKPSVLRSKKIEV